MMQVLACHDPSDPGSASVPAVDYTAGSRQQPGRPARRRRTPFLRDRSDLTDPETIAALETSILALRDMGATVGDVKISPFGVYADCGSLMSRSEAYAIHQHTGCAQHRSCTARSAATA